MELAEQLRKLADNIEWASSVSPTVEDVPRILAIRAQMIDTAKRLLTSSMIEPDKEVT